MRGEFVTARAALTHAVDLGLEVADHLEDSADLKISIEGAVRRRRQCDLLPFEELRQLLHRQPLHLEEDDCRELQGEVRDVVTLPSLLYLVHELTGALLQLRAELRSEEHTSELQSLMRFSYAVLCLKKKIELYTY